MARITVTPFNGFSGTVTFTCSVGSALTGATCLVTGSGNAQTLTVMVPAAASMEPGPRLQIFGGATGALLLLAVALLPAAFLLLSDPGAAAHLGRVSAGVALACVLFAAGCGASQSSSSTSNGNGNGNGTGGGTPSSSSVSVLGTSGGVTHTAQIVVTVN